MELCLITCNIRFDNPADGQNSWQNRRDFLADTLLKYSPSIIASQEGRFHQLNEFKDSLKNFEIIDQHRSWIGERMYPTLFIRRDHFEYISSGDLWLSETPEIAGSHSFESAFPRLLTWAKMQIKNTDKNLLVIDTHFDHIKSETRISQMQVLCNEIKKLWDPNFHLILMGDFNDSPESEVRRMLMTEFPDLQDAWKLFNSVEETSHHSFKGTIENGARIDWIMLDKNIKVLNSVMDKSVRDGIYPTDHYPIISNIKL